MKQVPSAEGSFQGGAVSWAGGMSVPVLGPRGEVDGRPQQLLYLCIGTIALRFKVMEIEV